VDLGHERWDVVFIANLVHHFDAATNIALFSRIARALRPTGVLVVQEVMRPERDARTQTGALGDLYFAALSAAGTYDYGDIAAWQREAGLVPRRPRRFVTYPDVGQQVATKR
jgi:SAM-dependent methyltransferase